jgi:hypothetical protein
MVHIPKWEFWDVTSRGKCECHTQGNLWQTQSWLLGSYFHAPIACGSINPSSSRNCGWCSSENLEFISIGGFCGIWNGCLSSDTPYLGEAILEYRQSNHWWCSWNYKVENQCEGDLCIQAEENRILQPNRGVSTGSTGKNVRTPRKKPDTAKYSKPKSIWRVKNATSTAPPSPVASMN